MLARTLGPRAALVVLGLAASVLLTACGHGLPSAESPALGTRVVASLPTDTGAQQTVPDAEAKALVIDFWAPGVPVCRRTIPALLKRKWDIEAKGAKLLLVASLEEGESQEDARTVLSSWGIDEHFAVDKAHDLLTKLGAREVPAIVILGRDGTVHWIAPDGVSPSDVLNAIP